MIIASGTTRNIAIIGFDERERTVIASLFKVSGIYQESRKDQSPKPDCVLLNVDDEEGRIWYDLEQQNPTGVPIVAVGADLIGNSVAAHIMRPFRWVQILDALEIAIERHRFAAPDQASAFPTTLFKPASSTAESAEQPQPDAPRLYKTVPAALIVNPNPKGWRHITSELASRGYRVDHVSSGAAAVVLLANIRYNLVFVETQLPEEDGVGICKMLNQAQGRRRATSIILSTSRAAVDRIRGKFAGCDAFISAPVDPDELSRTLDKLAPEYVLDQETHA